MASRTVEDERTTTDYSVELENIVSAENKTDRGGHRQREQQRQHQEGNTTGSDGRPSYYLVEPQQQQHQHPVSGNTGTTAAAFRDEDGDIVSSRTCSTDRSGGEGGSARAVATGSSTTGGPPPAGGGVLPLHSVITTSLRAAETEGREGDDDNEQEEAQKSAAARRQRAFHSCEVKHKVLVMIDEHDVDPAARAQEYALNSLLYNWDRRQSVEVIIFCCIEPRSSWRRVLFQSPARVRGTVSSQYNVHCTRLKQRLERFVTQHDTTDKFSAVIHLDCESDSSIASLSVMLSRFKPHIVLAGEHFGQPVQRHLKHTSQEAVVHLCASLLCSVMICRLPTANVSTGSGSSSALLQAGGDSSEQQRLQHAGSSSSAAQRHTAATRDEGDDDVSDSGAKDPYSIPTTSPQLQPQLQHQHQHPYGSLFPLDHFQGPTTFICCVNTNALFGHLPTSVATAASLCKAGDTIEIFSSYVTPDVATALYSTDGDWYDKVRNNMKGTKDAVARVQEKVQKIYVGVNAVTTISDDNFLPGLRRSVEQHRATTAQNGGRVVVVVGAGRPDNYIGRNIVALVAGHNVDKVVRTIPMTSVIIASK